MSNFQSLIATLGERGFTKGMSTSEGQFLHRDVNGTDEICVHLTESTFPANKPGANIWLQDAHNARPKHREDVLTGSFADFEGELFDRIVGLEAWAAKTTVEAVCMIQRRMGACTGIWRILPSRRMSKTPTKTIGEFRTTWTPRH
ncbi:hypothetical protein AYJ57_20440 (plasmid) [Salipiger sp. CCB-MM3]|nr:hypothetical protein AYJ57_20440 [Salipiger sp. CCB-MM3]